MVEQPPLMPAAVSDLTVAVASLALGGAERIVVDWAARIAATWRVHLIVLRDETHEWTVPGSVHVTRLAGTDVLAELRSFGRRLARGPTPVCVCHLLTARERDALAAGGAFVVPVVHNAARGWIEPASALATARHVIAVSDASRADLRRGGCAATVSVIRHVPQARRCDAGARRTWRAAWRIPADATVIGMIGAVKPQKDYPFAVRLLRTLLDRRDAYLAILGGPIGHRGKDAWLAVLDEMRRVGVRHRLAMPGFVAEAAACLAAFDLLLNTSDYEGLSIATLEALANGVPVVASAAGGQGELGGAALTIVPKSAPAAAWIDAIERALKERSACPVRPRWAGFPSHRLWTLAHLARPVSRNARVLFVTANLNAGGAQRSLVNLTCALRRISCAVAVTGDSTADYFSHELRRTGLVVHRTAASRDPFDHAERLVARICAEDFGTICFWNVDAKIKLLVAKALAFSNAALVDVSPGPVSFAEMRDADEEFGRLIAFRASEYYLRLDRLVLKYRGASPREYPSTAIVIPNGVRVPSRVKSSYEVGARPRVAVNGRIAPTKFVIEIIGAMDLVRRAVPGAELHLFGEAEPRHRDYAAAVARAAQATSGATIFHGAAGDTSASLPDFDALVVLGKDQGSPNALLEALAAGLPCVANDDGGTAEQIIDGVTGLLVRDRTAETLAPAIARVLQDRALAERLGRAGRQHVRASFAMDDMVQRYESLFLALAPALADEEVTV